MARRIDTYPLTIRGWRDDGVRPNQRHQLALLALANSIGLGHIFTEWRARRGKPPRRVLRPMGGGGCRSETAANSCSFTKRPQTAERKALANLTRAS